MQFKIANYASDEISAKDILVLKFIIESRTGILVRRYSISLLYIILQCCADIQTRGLTIILLYKCNDIYNNIYLSI